MQIVWILGILAALVGAGMLISRKRDTGKADSQRSRRRSTSGAHASSWAYFGGSDGGGGYGGGFDGGGCGGGDGGGGGGC